MKAPAAITPAFASARGAGGFGLLVVLLLVLPWALAAYGVPTREQLWRGIDSDSGATSFVWQQLFRERGDLDVVFFGASLMSAGIDTPQVQRALSRRMGREARVVTLAMNWRTEDRAHLLLDELLRHRKVGLLIASMPKPLHAQRWPGMSHEIGHWTTRLDADTAWARGIPLADRIGLAASHVLTGPRSLLYSLREGRLAPAAEAAHLGARPAKLGFMRSGLGDPTRFRPLEIRPPRFGPRASIHDAGSAVLRVSARGASAYQRYCIVQTFRLLADHDVPVLVLHLPGWPERGKEVIEELEDWGALARRPIPVLGVAPRELFAPLPDEDVELLFANPYHLNANGSEYFTEALLPAILEVAVRHGI